MNRLQRRTGVAVLCLGAALIMVACGSSATNTSGSSGPAGSTATNPSAGPNPNATESAPPGDIPDNQAFVPYAPKGTGYRLQVPEGWAMTQPGRATLFTDKYNSIRIEKLTVAKAPTVASATSTELPRIKAAAHGFVPGSVTAAPRKAGTAIKITYRADSVPNPVTGKVIVQAVERYEFWRAGREVVLTLSASLGSDNVDPWRKVTDSFAWMA